MSIKKRHLSATEDFPVDRTGREDVPFLGNFVWMQPPPVTHQCDRCTTGTYRAGVCGSCVDAERFERERAAALRRRLDCIPPRYRDSRFGSPAMQSRVADARAVDVARAAVVSHKVVVFQGVAGSGKSTLAAAVLAAEAERGKTIAWASAMRLAHARAEGRLGAEPPEVREAIRADVVCIDDLGNEGLTLTSAVVDVIFRRHDAEKPLIVTTGLSRLDLARRYGAGAGRRLLEESLVVDLRLLKGATT